MVYPGQFEGINMEYITLVVIISLCEYLFFAFAVGKAREKYKISAPSTTGNTNFERYFRVQQNHLEQLIVFIPAIYMAGYYMDTVSAAIIGCFFIVGRMIYYKSYVVEPSKRSVGFIISFIPILLLLTLALVGIFIRLIK